MLSNSPVPGLEDNTTEGEQDQDGVTDRFAFVDGVTEGIEFFEEPFKFPWQGDEPDGFEGNSNCVRYSSTIVSSTLLIHFL